MGINGLLTDVRWEWTGTEITADLLADETVLPVLDPESITAGEFVWVAGTGVYEIVSVDVDAATFTITPGLTEDADSGAEVARDIGGEPGRAWVCEVILADAERPIEVPLTVHDLAVMSEGTYDPPVAIILSDDLSQVVDLPGSLPSIDGEYMLPGSIPTAPTTDGIAPTESPATTLAPLYSTFLAHWPAQSNADLVGYKVWLSAPDVTAGEVGLTYATNFHVTAEPDGSPLRRNVNYTVWVIAFDADGAAPAGTSATASLSSITPADIEQAILDSITAAQADASDALTAAGDAATAAGNAQTAADAAADAAAEAAGLAAGKSVVLFQGTAPGVADQNDKTLWIDTSGGGNTPKRWDGDSWEAVTDKVATDAAAAAAAAASAAADAQADATQALSDAFDANEAAGLAQTTANGKNAVWYLPSAPPGTNHKLHDVWFNTTGGHYIPNEWDGDSWEPRPWGHQSIASMDAGKITVGFLAAARIAANTIGVQHLAVADQTNLWPDPYFNLIKNDAGDFTVRMSNATWASTPTPPSGGNVAVLNARDHIGTDSFAVKPGDEFLIEVTYRYTSGSAVFLSGLWQKKADGTDTTVVAPYVNGKRERLKDAAGVDIPDVNLGGGWFRQSLVVQINPAATDAARASLWLQIDQPGVSGTVVTVSDISLRRRGKGSLLVDGSVSARQVGADVITANESYAKTGYIGVFSADQIGTGFLKSAITLSGVMKTGDTGQRVAMDGQGLHLFSPTNEPLVDLPTDPTKPVSIKNVNAEVQNLAVKGGLSIETAGTVGAGAGLELVGGVIAPSTAPTVLLDHEVNGTNYSVPIPASLQGTASTSYVVAVAYDATYAYLAVQIGSAYFLAKCPINGGAAVLATNVIASSTNSIWGLAIDPADGKLWVGWKSDFTRSIKRYSNALVDESVSRSCNLASGSGTYMKGMAIYNGIAYCGFVRGTDYYPQVDKIILANSTFAGSAATAGPSGVSNTYSWGLVAGVFDFGDGIVRIGFNLAGRIVFYSDSGGVLTERPTDQFDTGADGGTVSDDPVGWDPGTSLFRQVQRVDPFASGDTTLSLAGKRYTSIKWTTESSQWWASFTWRDSVGTPHQTDQGKRASFTMKQRYRLRLTSAAIPNYGGADDPNSVSFYLGRNATDPGRTGMWLQGGTLPNGQTTLDLSSVSLPGSTNPPDPTNNLDAFPGSTPGYIKSGAKRADGQPRVKIDGLGAANVDGLIPPGTVQMWAGTSATPPTGWVFCNGTSTPLNTGVNMDLFNAIGYTFGGSGTTFYPPDFTDKFPIGAGVKAVGAAGGNSTKPVPAHTHDTTLAAHTHDTTLSSHTHFDGTYSTNNSGSHDHGNGTLAANTLNDRASGSGGRATATITGRTGSDGSSHSHDVTGESGGVVGANPSMTSGNPNSSPTMTSGNPSGAAFDVMNPWLAIKFIIKL